MTISLSVSFRSLQAFMEVARCGSFKVAARTLGVTPAAVSQMVKALELRMSVKLLDRQGRDIRPTVDGLRLLEPLCSGFGQIETAIDSLSFRKSHQETLRVTTTPSLAVGWLVPRLGKFQTLHPEIELRLDTTIRVMDLRKEAPDVALRHGSGDYTGCDAVKFYTPRLIAVASSCLLARGRPLAAPRDVLAYPLLHDRDRIEWARWLAAHGVDDADGLAQRGPGFENDLLLIRAAIAGQGIALVRDIYAREEIRAERLHIAFDFHLPTVQSYYVVCARALSQKAKVIAFRDWILHEADAELCGQELECDV